MTPEMTPEPDAGDYFAGLYRSSDDPWLLRISIRTMTGCLLCGHRMERLYINEKRVNVCHCVFS